MTELASRPSLQDGHLTIKPETLNMFQACEDIRKAIVVENSSNPHISWQIVSQFVHLLSTEDPCLLHYAVTRSTLEKIDAELLKQQNAIDLLTRYLNEFCKKLKSQFSLPFTQFETNNMFLQDAIFLKVLASTGKTGITYAKKMENACIRRLEIHKTIGKTPLGFWFNLNPETNHEHLFLSPCLHTLAGAIWHDVVKRLAHFINHQIPALSTNVHQPILQILSPKNVLKETSEQLCLSHQDTIIGKISVATISEKIIKYVSNGCRKLRTVTGHRIIRYLVQRGFAQLANGHPDYRVIKLDRGVIEIVEQLELPTKAITDITEVLHAMAFLEFPSTTLRGNLLQLSKYTSPYTGRKEEGYYITIGPPLLPYQTFQAQKSGENSLLIPLLADPPLVGAKPFHGGQYLFQMELLEEFSKKSIELVQIGAIQIPNKRWEELGASCGLNIDITRRIQDRWTQDGDLEKGSRLFERLEGDFYTLGPSHNKALEFLQKQGQLRIIQSNRGKSSAQQRINPKTK